MNSSNALPALRGGLIATAAAFLYDVSTPLIQRCGVGSASLLRRGLHRRAHPSTHRREARLRLGDGKRLVLMALFGAAIGPVALAWGLRHTSCTTALLMLPLEAVFTAVLARLWYHETLDRRVMLATALLTLGVMALGAGLPAWRIPASLARFNISALSATIKVLPDIDIAAICGLSTNG